MTRLAFDPRSTAAAALAADPIVVTGLGSWAAGSRSPDELYALALRGRATAEWIDLDGPTQPLRVAGSAASAIDLEHPTLRPVRRLDRVTQLAMLAATQAWNDAGLDWDSGLDADRVGVYCGTSRGPILKWLESVEAWGNGGVRPGSSAQTTMGSLNGVLSQALGALGPSASVVATCASAAAAIGMAAAHLLLGEADVAIAGGAEAPIISLMAAQLGAAGVVGHHEDPHLTCRPFHAERNGLAIGEGAGFLVLERFSSARARGRVPYARLAGWASRVDAGGRTGVTANGDGLVRAMRRALDVAEMAPRDIGYVNAHGTGTVVNDAVECLALNEVFGAGMAPPVSSTKPVTGHCLGATPALEAIISILALRAGCLPPTANLDSVDPACDVDLISDEPRPAAVDSVLSTSLGFWGTQAALVFTR